MKKIKILSVFAALMVFSLTTYAQAECTLVGGLRLGDFRYEYWCYSGPQGCFWDIYFV